MWKTRLEVKEMKNILQREVAKADIHGVKSLSKRATPPAQECSHRGGAKNPREQAADSSSRFSASQSPWVQLESNVSRLSESEAKRAGQNRSLRWIDAKSLGRKRSRKRYALWGEIPPTPRLAVVGSRAALHRHRESTQAILAAAQECGWSLVSGGALGIDAFAHRAALQLQVPQVAVLPCPPEECYPPDHAELFHSIARQAKSGVLYALEPGQAMRREVFAGRNRIVLDLADALVVVQAQLASGSWGTGRLAMQRDLQCVVLAGSPGTESLYVQGAPMLNDSKASTLQQDVKAWLRGEGPSSSSPPGHGGEDWPSELASLLTEVAKGPRHGKGVDDFQDPFAAMVNLGRALAEGWVLEASPGRYTLAPRSLGAGGFHRDERE